MVLGLTCILAGCLFVSCAPSPIIESIPTDTPDEMDVNLRQLLAEADVEPLAELPAPDENMYALGQALFFDKELSGNRDISCATCHHPTLATADALSLSIGVGGVGLGTERVIDPTREFVPRNAPDIFNRGDPGWLTMFWDSRVSGTLETRFNTPAGVRLPAEIDSLLAAQAMFPVTSPDEMRGERGDVDVFGEHNELAPILNHEFEAIWDALMQRLLAIPEYQELFAAAYPDVPEDELNFAHAANAIAVFEATSWHFTDSPWDRYLLGDDSALTLEAKRGAILFYGEAGCGECHSGPLLTDQQHYNMAVPQIGPGKGLGAPLDLGRAEESDMDEDRFAFRTPPLRNVVLTGPWMHNGTYTTLEAAVLHQLDPLKDMYAYDPTVLDPLVDIEYITHDYVVSTMLETIDPVARETIELSQAEIGDLLAFLEALTSPSALDMSDDIPESVPSGLPVND
ncbi:MAG: cytochrome-c peroxidase [Chloroflexi bacterium]|nr:MAG: cytochrome-c peroxidase [Chloroflexota bacterium]MBL1194594.1 cytochrome-c peroxidase [Chloroflexota bacterium]